MSTRTAIITSFAAFSFVAFLSGCSDSAAPLTDENIRLMSNSRYGFATIERHGEHESRVSLPPDEYETMRSLVRSLGPIESSEPGQIADFDYTLSFQAGMDPAVFRIKAHEVSLQFEFDGCVYVVDDAKEFMSLLPDSLQ